MDSENSSIFLGVAASEHLAAELSRHLAPDCWMAPTLFQFLRVGLGFIASPAGVLAKRIAVHRLLNLYEVNGNLFMTNGPFPVIPLRNMREWESVGIYAERKKSYEYAVIYWDGFENVYTKDGFILDAASGDLVRPAGIPCVSFMYKRWFIRFDKSDNVVIEQGDKKISSANTMSSVRLFTAECEAPVRHGWFGYRINHKPGQRADQRTKDGMEFVEILFDLLLKNGSQISGAPLVDALEMLDEIASFKVQLRAVKRHYLDVPRSRSATPNAAVLDCLTGTPACVLRSKNDPDGLLLRHHAHIAQYADSSVVFLQNLELVTWTNIFVP